MSLNLDIGGFRPSELVEYVIFALVGGGVFISLAGEHKPLAIYVIIMGAILFALFVWEEGK